MKIDVVLATDDRYARHCGAAVSSLLHNNPKHDISVHILYSDLSEKNRARLSKTVRRFSSRIIYHPLDNALISGLPRGGDHAGITLSTYLRLFMAGVLRDIPKVLYMDCDMIVRHDIGELWQTDISGAALAASPDSVPGPAVKRLGYPVEYEYFAAGLLLINLKYWREQNATALFLDYMEKNRALICAHDQDVLNGVFHKEKIILPVKWNFYVDYAFSTPDIREEYLQQISRCAADPAIVHFEWTNKPWLVPGLPFGEEYFKYARMTPWGAPPRPGKHQKGFLSRSWKWVKDNFLNRATR